MNEITIIFALFVGIYGCLHTAVSYSMKIKSKIDIIPVFTFGTFSIFILMVTWRFTLETVLK